MAGFFIRSFGTRAPRVSPRLLRDDQAQTAKNLNPSSGELAPLKGLAQVGSGLLSKPGTKKTIYRWGQQLDSETQYWFHWTADVHVVRGPVAGDTIERTYFTGDVEPRMTYSPIAVTGASTDYPLAWYKLGIPAPSTSPNTPTASNRVISSITRAGTTATATTAEPHGLLTGQSVVISGATPSQYNGTFQITVTGSNTFTYTMASDPGVDASGSPVYNLGGAGEYRVYVVTYVSGLGEEGPPSPPTTAVLVIPGQKVSLSGIPGAPTGNYNITKKRIYRTVSGNDETTYRFVAEIDVAATTYDDTKESSALGERIPSLTWVPPPTDLKGLIAFANGMLAGISGNQVCLTPAFQPHAWPVAFRYAVPFDPVALATFGNTILVLTVGMPSLLTGTDPSAMSQEDLKVGQPCASAQSVVEIGGQVFWASPEGIAQMGPSGYRLATEAIFSKTEWAAYKPESIRAYRWQNRYVGFYDTGTVQAGFIFDPATGDFWDIDLYATAGYTDPKRGELYLAQGNEVKKFDAGTALTHTWRSKVFSLPRPANPSVAKVVARSYPVNFGLYGDGVLRHSRSVQNSRAFLLPSGYKATDFEVELSGTVNVQGVAVAESMEELKGLSE